MRVFRPLICIVPLMLAAYGAAAQKPVELQEVRRLLLYFEVAEEAEFDQQQQTLLYESLAAALSIVSDKAALLEYRGSGVPAEDTERSTAAETAGADSWLQVTVRGDFKKAVVQARCLDLLNGITAFELEEEKEIIRGTRDLGLEFWNEVEEAVSAYFEQALNMENTTGELSLQAVAGTRIRGIGPKRLKTTDAGVATAEVPLPSTLRYRATRPGYWPVEGQIYVDQPQKQIVIEQTPGSRAAVEIYLHNFSFPGFDFSVYLIPDMVYARAGILTYLFGFVLEGDDEDELFVSYSLNHYNISLGFYLNAPDRYFRPYFSAGAFWRIIATRGFWGLEPIAPFGMQPVLGFEYSRQPRYKLYFEFAPMVHWTGGQDNTFLFLLSLPRGDRSSGYLPLDWCVVNLLNFKTGVRVRL